MPKSAMETVKDLAQRNQVDLAVIKNDIDSIKGYQKDIHTQLNSNYVTKEEFDPIKRGFYYVVSLLVLAFVGGLVALIWK